MSDSSKVKTHILGYGYMLENEILTEFKRIYPKVLVNSPERTERPTIDVTDCGKRPTIALNTNSIGASYFKAEPGFRPRVTAPPARKIVSYIDIDGLIRYKYA